MKMTPREKVPFSMAIGNVQLEHECCLLYGSSKRKKTISLEVYIGSPVGKYIYFFAPNTHCEHVVALSEKRKHHSVWS